MGRQTGAVKAFLRDERVTERGIGSRWDYVVVARGGGDAASKA
jgi:hypothetical protein